MLTDLIPGFITIEMYTQVSDWVLDDVFEVNESPVNLDLLRRLYEAVYEVEPKEPRRDDYRPGLVFLTIFILICFATLVLILLAGFKYIFWFVIPIGLMGVYVSFKDIVIAHKHVKLMSEEYYPAFQDWAEKLYRADIRLTDGHVFSNDVEYDSIEDFIQYIKNSWK